MKIDVILTIHNQEQELVNETSLKSVFKYIEKLNSVIIINSNKDLVVDDSNEKVTLIETDKNTKLEKLSIAAKALSKKKESTHIIVLDADDALINLDEFFALNVSCDLILTSHIYHRESEGEWLRKFNRSQKDWANIEKFPYYGNQSMIVSKDVFIDSIKDLKKMFWQRGEDGFRMLQYMTKSKSIDFVDGAFTKFNRFKNVNHTSLIKVSEFNDDFIKGINIKFKMFVKLYKKKKIVMWHDSQWNWLELSLNKYKEVVSPKTIDRLKEIQASKWKGHI